jgi:peptide/nickel transport system substrate-binding protein
MQIRKATTAKLVAAAAVVLALGANAVAGASTSNRSVAPHVPTNATYALDQTLLGFNVNTSASNLFVLQEIMNLVWPQTYVVDNHLALKLNTQLVTSATSALVSGSQVLTYHLNPAAKWQDGTPIAADDFSYNFQAYWGCPGGVGVPCFKDKGGAVYDVAGSTGYNQIKSVKGAGPFRAYAARGWTSTKCAAGKAAEHNVGLCPNGETVKVTFIKGQPFADWQGLFGDIVPAHVARNVGWNTGFNPSSISGGNPLPVQSGSWYKIQSYSGNTVVLSRNANYWSTPGKLATITFLDAPDDSLGISDLTSHTTDVFNPNSVDSTLTAEAKAAGTAIHWSAIGSLSFEHIDFNEKVAGLNLLDVRKAIADGTNRKAIISAVLGSIAPKTPPLGNHMFFPGQSSYVDNFAAYVSGGDATHIAAAKTLLSHHYHMGTDSYFQTTGTGSAHDLTFTISSTGNAVRNTITMPLFQAQMKKIGIKINIHGYADFFTDYFNQNYQIGLFAWVGGPFVSANQSIYCSAKYASKCGQNETSFSNATVDTDLFKGAASVSAATERADYAAADKILAANVVTLPLYQRPEFFAWNPALLNVTTNASSAGATWNAQTWHY